MVGKRAAIANVFLTTAADRVGCGRDTAARPSPFGGTNRRKTLERSPLTVARGSVAHFEPVEPVTESAELEAELAVFQLKPAAPMRGSLDRR